MTFAPFHKLPIKLRLFLTASLLLHILLSLAVLWLVPGRLKKPTDAPGSITVSLATLPDPTGHTRSTASSAPSIPPAPKPESAQEAVKAPKKTVPVAAARYPDAVQEPKAAPANNPIAATIGSTAAQTTEPPDTGYPTGSEAVAADTTTPKEMRFGSTNGPAFRTQAIPAYPALAKRRGKEGVVLLRLNISKTGQLTQIEVLQDPGYGFSEAAQAAARNSSFTPARHNGRPIAVRATLPIRFTLR